MTSAKLAKLYEETGFAFLRAERAIKRFEHLTLATPVAAVNQLRYAGFHFIKIWKLEKQCISVGESDSLTAIRVAAQEELQRELEEAKSHCNRAWCDAFDGLLTTHLSFARDFVRCGYRADDLKRYYPEFDADCQFLDQVTRQLRTSSVSQRMTLYRMAKTVHAVRKVKAIRQRIEGAMRLLGDEKTKAARDARNRAKIIKYNENVLRKRELLISLSATICGTVIGAAGTLATVYGLSKFSSPVDPAAHPVFWTLGTLGAFIVSFLLCIIGINHYLQKLAKRCPELLDTSLPKLEE